MTTIQVNITTQVNAKQIRRENHNGRDYVIVPSMTLPENCILNGGLYTAEQINKHYHKLEGTLAPLGHPQVNGKFVSAFSPEGINLGHFGAFNRNVKKEGNRIYLEKWIDVEVANRSDGGKRVLKRVEDLESGASTEPVHTSVAVFLDRLEPNALQKKQGASWVASISDMDHDCVLLDAPGAATPEDGVGMMVNADEAVSLAPNAGALTGESYREKERRIELAAKERFSDSEYVWIADFTDEQAIIIRDGGAAEMYGYRSEGGKIRFDDQGSEVERQESWITKNPIVNKLLQTFGLFDVKSQQQKPVTTNVKEAEMAFTPEERAELVKDIAKELSANVSGPLASVVEKLEKLEANHQKLATDLTANSRAEEAEKRAAVAAEFGQDVADQLQGNALDNMYKKLGKAAPIVNGKNGEEKQNFAEVPE